jgi:hypothetical protein
MISWKPPMIANVIANLAHPLHEARRTSTISSIGVLKIINIAIVDIKNNTGSVSIDQVPNATWLASPILEEK